MPGVQRKRDKKKNILALGMPETCMRYMYKFADRASGDTIDCRCDEELDSNFCRKNCGGDNHRYNCSH